MKYATDDNFYNRADDHIKLANQQLGRVGMAPVGGSMMFAVARFNTWVNAYENKSRENLQRSRDEIIQESVAQYKKMLEDNLDDYIENFDNYMQRG